jgi:DNA-binding MarR family transcriptional regulator
VAAAELLEVVPAVMRAIRAQMRSTAARELSVVQFRALAFMDRQPGVSLTDLKDHIGLSLPSVSKLVQGLLARGFLHRAENPADRRRNALVATAKGKRVLEAARAVTRQSLADRLAALGDEELRTLRAALAALRPVFLSDVWPRDQARGSANLAAAGAAAITAAATTTATNGNGHGHRAAAATAAAPPNKRLRPRGRRAVNRPRISVV